MIDALDRFWREHNANVHRGVHTLSEEATSMYEDARLALASHLGADRREVIFVRNATEALNLVAYAWGRTNLGASDRILVTEMEHHSNIVPWYQVAQEKAHLDWAPVTGEGRLDLDGFAELLERGPKLVCVAHVSNVLGTINPVAEIARGPRRRRLGGRGRRRPARSSSSTWPSWERTSTPSLSQDVRTDGDRRLFGRRELLEEMPPFIGGGSMIRKVSKELITWADLPAKFEAERRRSRRRSVRRGDPLARGARPARRARRGGSDRLRAGANRRGSRTHRLRPARW